MPWLPSVVWLVLLILFTLTETATAGLVSVWFAAGALIALLSTFFTDSIWLQIAIFLAVSAVTMAVLRPVAKKYVIPKRTATNADRVIGKEAVVTEDIDNLKGRGAVTVCGTAWTARSATDDPISAGETVTVKCIDGVKLFVAPIPEHGKE